jgi:hypothetical protein
MEIFFGIQFFFFCSRRKRNTNGKGTGKGKGTATRFCHKKRTVNVGEERKGKEREQFSRLIK